MILSSQLDRLHGEYYCISGSHFHTARRATTYGVITLERDEIQRKVESVDFWYHTRDVGGGIVTPGEKKCDDFDRLGLPDLRGRTVLDVGCWDGFYSFECEKRGASKVLATDHYVWNAFGKQGFLTAREILDAGVDHKDIDPLDILPETVGTWDIVLFLGVLYHLRDPLSVLERIARVTKHLLVVESHIVNLPMFNNIPMAAFYENDELNDDPTNWWGPNLKCLTQMVRSAGFQPVEIKQPEKKTRGQSCWEKVGGQNCVKCAGSS
jgi:tRNA (mo5U34)-methyltransferase